MTRSEWIQKYVAAMKEGGSSWSEQELIAHAENGCDATEESYSTNPDEWECPEIIAKEDLEADGGSEVN